MNKDKIDLEIKKIIEAGIKKVQLMKKILPQDF